MLLELTLPSYLRLALLSTPKRYQGIKSLLKPGDGYDRYHSLKRSIAYQIEKGEFTEDPGFIDSLSKVNEKTANAKAFEAFGTWAKPETRYWENVDLKRHLDFPMHSIRLICKPDFVTIEKNEVWLHQVWATNSVELTQSYAGVGCYVIREAFKETHFGNARSSVLDLSRSMAKRFSNKQIPVYAKEILENDLASFSRIARELLAEPA